MVAGMCPRILAYTLLGLVVVTQSVRNTDTKTGVLETNNVKEKTNESDASGLSSDLFQLKPNQYITSFENNLRLYGDTNRLKKYGRWVTPIWCGSGDSPESYLDVTKPMTETLEIVHCVLVTCTLVGHRKQDPKVIQCPKPEYYKFAQLASPPAKGIVPRGVRLLKTGNALAYTSEGIKLVDPERKKRSVVYLQPQLISEVRQTQERVNLYMVNPSVLGPSGAGRMWLKQGDTRVAQPLLPTSVTWSLDIEFQDCPRRTSDTKALAEPHDSKSLAICEAEADAQVRKCLEDNRKFDEKGFEEYVKSDLRRQLAGLVSLQHLHLQDCEDYANIGGFLGMGHVTGLLTPGHSEDKENKRSRCETAFMRLVRYFADECREVTHFCRESYVCMLQHSLPTVQGTTQ